MFFNASKNMLTSPKEQNIGLSDALPERIQNKIKVKKTGCWEWQDFKYQGYGRLRWKGFRTRKAHRIVYELLVGPIGALELDHLCKNPSCVNPAHLEPVTRVENLRRSDCASSKNRIKAHCSRGHEFTPTNTYIHRNKRYCRKCFVLNNWAYQQRKKGRVV